MSSPHATTYREIINGPKIGSRGFDFIYCDSCFIRSTHYFTVASHIGDSHHGVFQYCSIACADHAGPFTRRKKLSCKEPYKPKEESNKRKEPSPEHFEEIPDDEDEEAEIYSLNNIKKPRRAESTFPYQFIDDELRKHQTPAARLETLEDDAATGFRISFLAKYGYVTVRAHSNLATTAMDWAKVVKHYVIPSRSVASDTKAGPVWIDLADFKKHHAPGIKAGVDLYFEMTLRELLADVDQTHELKEARVKVEFNQAEESTSPPIPCTGEGSSSYEILMCLTDDESIHVPIQSLEELELDAENPTIELSKLDLQIGDVLVIRGDVWRAFVSSSASSSAAGGGVAAAPRMCLVASAERKKEC